MLSRTHAASAAAVAGLALHIFKPSPVVSVFVTAGTIVGSILPDIDTTSIDTPTPKDVGFLLRRPLPLRAKPTEVLHDLHKRWLYCFHMPCGTV